MIFEELVGADRCMVNGERDGVEMKIQGIQDTFLGKQATQVSWG